MIVARSASPANTRSTSARSRSLGVTLLDTDVGSLPRLLGRYERNLRPSFIYTRAETRPVSFHDSFHDWLLDACGWPAAGSARRRGARESRGAARATRLGSRVDLRGDQEAVTCWFMWR